MIAVAVLTVAELTVAVLTVAVLISGVRTCLTCRKEPWLPFGPTKVSSGQHRWHPGPLCPQSYEPHNRLQDHISVGGCISRQPDAGLT